MEVSDGALEQPELEVLVGPTGEAALDGAGHREVLFGAGAEEIGGRHAGRRRTGRRHAVGERVGHDGGPIERRRLDDDDQDAVGERGDHHVREEVVDERQPSVDRALARLDRFQLQDVAEREGHPAVGTEALDEVDIVELHGEERVGMGEAQVIALEERLDLDLPVGRLLPLGGAEQLVLGADEPGDLVEGVIGRRIAVLVDHDETVPLPAGHRHEAPRGAVEVREAVGVGHVAQTAVEAVRPRVVRADERLGAARPVDELGAAMAAGVAERAHASGGIADGQDRCSGGVAGDVRPGVRERGRRAQRRGVAAQHPLELGAEPFGRSVVGHRLPPSAIAHVGRAVTHVVEDPLGDGLVVVQQRHALRYHTI